jgi:co-chaperonin GroES (HSP10)
MTLILPAHLQKKAQNDKKEEENKKDLDKIPQPTGWRIVVLPFKSKDKTKGGVLLSDKTVENTQLTSVVALVLATGPDAYQDKDKFPNGPWCKKGDWVVFARYAGSRVPIEGGEIRILNDDEILARVEDPEDILQVY